VQAPLSCLQAELVKVSNGSRHAEVRPFLRNTPPLLLRSRSAWPEPEHPRFQSPDSGPCSPAWYGRAGAVWLAECRFASRRVRTAPSDAPGCFGPEEWLLIKDADEPSDRSHCLISLPTDTPLAGRAGLPRPQAGGRARPLRGMLLVWPEPPPQSARPATALGQSPPCAGASLAT
jgi:hypothetical protein